MRDESVSMTKGVAIILMVMAHARCPMWGQQFINMFHMPLFFFMSGYCFKIAYLDDFRSYALKRIKGAYLPFVKWGLIFLLLHNVFYDLNIYNDQYGFRGSVSELYTIQDFFKHAFLIVTTMTDVERLLGGYWFLHSYFIASFIMFATIWLFRKKSGDLLIGGGILLMVSVLMALLNIRIPFYLEAKEVLASLFMVLGFVYKGSHLQLETKKIALLFISLIIVVIGTFLWPCGMMKLTWEKVIPYTFSALAGILVVFSLCKKLAEYSFIPRVLTYVGDRTLTILTWHFLCFKLVSLVIIMFYSLPIERLAEYPVIEEFAYVGWWPVYLVFGVSASLLIDSILYKLKSVIKQRHE